MKLQIAIQSAVLNKEFSIDYRIYYEDTDAGGVVYYANYLKFFERARTEFLRSLNISQSTLAKELSLIFVVRKCEIEYKNSARLDDLVTIKTIVLEIGTASIIIHQRMFLEEKLLNVLKVEIVCVDSNSMKPKKIPSEILEKINQ